MITKIRQFKTIFPVIILCCVQLLCLAQSEDDNSYTEHKSYHTKPNKKLPFDIVFGGELGQMAFGNPTVISLSPLIGARFKEKYILGLKPTYTYFRAKYPAIANNVVKELVFTTHIAGAGVFGRYQFFDFLYGHLEYEYLSYKRAIVDNASQTLDSEKIGVPGLYIGGGYMNGGLYIEALFNVLYDTETSLRSNPMLRIGYIGAIY